MYVLDGLLAAQQLQASSHCCSWMVLCSSCVTQWWAKVN